MASVIKKYKIASISSLEGIGVATESIFKSYKNKTILLIWWVKFHFRLGRSPAGRTALKMKGFALCYGKVMAE